jgi:hypothetical protein
MIEFILVYLFFASCMAAASRAESNEPTSLGLLLVSLFWPWFLVTTLFQKIIK